MNGLRSPRPREPFDLAAAVSLARQALAAGNSADALNALKLLLRDLDAIAAEVHEPFRFDRAVIAEALQYPERFALEVRAMQAALLRGTLGPDTPMADPYRRATRLHQDDGA